LVFIKKVFIKKEVPVKKDNNRHDVEYYPTVKEMKEWQVTLGGSIVMFMAGIVMFLWARNLETPSTFLGDNNYFLISNQYFSIFLTGALFIGFSGGLLICTLLIYQLEAKLCSN